MKIGVSVYPHLLKSREELETFLHLLHEEHVDILFTTLIGQQKTNYQIFERVKLMGQFCAEHNIDLYCDLSNDEIKNFGLADASAATIVDFCQQKLHLKGVRFDDSRFDSASKFVELINNDQGLRFIWNGSLPGDDYAKLLAHKANVANVLASYNFYPLKYSASSLDYFHARLATTKRYSIRMQTFLASQEPLAVGPWPYNEQVPSIEMHRYQPLDFQFRHFQAMGVAEVVLSSHLATKRELQMLRHWQRVSEGRTLLKMHLQRKLSANEAAIVFDRQVHFVRPDLAAYMLRSTWSRIKYRDRALPADNSYITQKDLHPGDVVLLNDLALNYKGEVHIITATIPNEAKYNLVGTFNYGYETAIWKELKANDQFLIIPATQQ